MSFFGDLNFFICLTVLIIPAIVLGLCQKPLKQYSFLLSLAFIVLIFGPKLEQLAYLVLFYFVELHIVKIYLLLRKRFGRKPVIYGHAVAFSILPLVISKVSGVFDHNIFGFLGISYLTFKVVQIIIETYDNVIKEISLFDFSSFLLFFPVLSSGPIDRSRRYISDLNKVYSRQEYLSLLGSGLQKITLGLLYKFAFSAIMFEIMGGFAEHLGVLELIGYSYSYGFYMFFDFAGYSLMAVGASYILGIRTPDNFKRPFLSVDMKDFWNRWHITLSHWFRDFIFSRFMMNAIRKKWFSTRLTGAAVGLIVNMLIMGVWHGLTSYYILYGLYHGVLLAITEVYQKKSKFYARHKNNRVYKLVSWFCTLNAVMFGFLIFSGHFNTAVHALFTKLL